MSEINTPREHFLHELANILYVEEQLEQEVLPQLIGEEQNPELRKGLEKHLSETRAHVENVEQVVEQLGEEPKREEGPGFDGLKKEHDQLAAETAPELIDLVVTGAVARTEHYEITAYESLTIMARALGERDVIELLEKNQKDDKETLRQIESLARELSKEQVKEMSEA